MNQPTIDVEAVRRMTEQMRAALAPAIARHAAVVRQMHTAMRPFIELMEQDPEWLDRMQQQHATGAEAGSCNCLCGVHRNRAEEVCRGQAEPGVTFTFRSPTVGTQHVPMCVPCHAAHVERLADPLASSPDAMAVTFD